MSKDISIPKHVAVIMDGNGRWAKERGKNRLFGHKAGIEAAAGRSLAAFRALKDTARV